MQSRGSQDNQVIALVYNQPVRVSDIRHIQSLFQTAYTLGLPNFTREEFSRDYNFAFNYLVAMHQAAAFGINPTQTQIEDAIKKIPYFQVNAPKDDKNPNDQAKADGGFDPEKYKKYVGGEDSLRPSGVAARELEDLVRADLQIGAIRQLTSAMVVLPKDALHQDFQKTYGIINSYVVRIPEKLIGEVPPVTEEEIQKYADAHKEELKRPEQRKVQYVAFELTEDQKKQDAKDRVAAMQKLAEEVEKFTDQLANDPKADFQKVAADFHLQAKETPAFDTQDATEQLAKQDLPKDLINDFATASFHLQPSNPVSEPLPNSANDTFYVIHLASMDAARPLSPEEAKPKIVQALQDARKADLVKEKGEALHAQLNNALTQGKSIEDAAREIGLAAEAIPPFTITDNQQTLKIIIQPEGPTILKQATQLEDKTLSQFIAATPSAVAPVAKPDEKPKAPDAGLFVYVQNHLPVEEQSKVSLADFSKKRLEMRQQIAFYEWLRVQRDKAGIDAQAMAASQAHTKGS